MLPDQLREVRIKVAASKLERVLRRQVVCHQKELERRVCEVGFSFYPLAPQEERPEPIHMKVARERLARADVIDSYQRTVRGNSYNFWFLTDGDEVVIRAALDVKLAATAAFDAIHHNEHLSGFAAERVHWNAIGQAGDWHRQPYEPGKDIRLLNGHVTGHGVDLAAVHMPSQVKAVVQVKNTREWYYPASAAVWQLLVSAIELDAVPVLIARRIAEPTFLLMDHIGGFAVPTFNTYIDQAAKSQPEWEAFERASETLGYKDVKVVDPRSPERRHVKVWSQTLPPRLLDLKAKFDAVKEDVNQLAEEKEGMSQGEWRTAFDEFMSAQRGEVEVDLDF